MIQVDIRRLLKFFDEKPADGVGHATGIVAVAGEDLGAGLLKHYLERVKGAKATVLRMPVTTGKKKGPRLDRWIDVVWPNGSGTLYQCEIKNWSAHAFSGKDLVLRVDASPSESKRFAIACWQDQWTHIENATRKDLSKVLVPMKRPPAAEADSSHNVEPLIIYWWVLYPEGQSECLFSHPLEPRPDCPFTRLWFFSMSSYLRSLSDPAVELEMPAAEKRIGWLHQLFG